MKHGKRMIGLTLASMMLLSLAVPTAGFADPMKDKGQKDKLWKQGPPQWVLEKFTSVEGSKIKFNKKSILFDTAPVIKEGRTLIPIRAITEGMGGTVKWDGAEMIVTVTHPDSDVEIVFYLKTGKVEVDGEEVTIDVKPGLHNNRTYVPLRFIAETFGLKVSHDGKTGETDIEKGPSLDPGKVVFEEEADIDEDVDVKLANLGDYEFVEIKNLDDSHYSLDGDVVTLEKEYIEGLNVENTQLVFRFEDEDDTIIERTFKIVLEYNGSEEVLPILDPATDAFNGDNPDDIDVTLPEDYTLVSIMEGSNILDDDGDNADYDVDSNEVTLYESYLEDLDEDTPLKFTLKDEDGEELKLTFTVEIE